MEETKKQKWLGRMEEIKNKSGWKEELVKWYQPHMVMFYMIAIASAIIGVSCGNTLLMLAPFEILVVTLCIFIIIVLNYSMWNNCMIRQTVEELKSKLKRLE